MARESRGPILSSAAARLPSWQINSNELINYNSLSTGYVHFHFPVLRPFASRIVPRYPKWQMHGASNARSHAAHRLLETASAPSLVPAQLPRHRPISPTDTRRIPSVSAGSTVMGPGRIRDWDRAGVRHGRSRDNVSCRLTCELW